MRKILGGVGTAVAIVAIIGFKYLAPSAEVAVNNAMGTGWDDARDEFLKEIADVINTDYDVFVLSETDKENIANCIVDKSIGFLNTTDCSYMYNTATTSESEHLATQEKCMETVKFASQQEAFSLECLRAHMPASWAVMKKVLLGVYEEAYIAQGIAVPEAKKISECISSRLVALCDERKYKLVDETAKDAESLFLSIDTHIPDFENDEGVKTIMTECAPGGEAVSN